MQLVTEDKEGTLVLALTVDVTDIPETNLLNLYFIISQCLYIMYHIITPVYVITHIITKFCLFYIIILRHNQFS